MPVWLAPAIAASAQLTMKGIEWLQNRRAQKKQNEYNSPKAQRNRMAAAGYNPNLFYGQGNPGNQSQPVPTPQWSQVPMEALAAYNQTRLTDSTLQTNGAKIAASVASTELTKIKTAVEASNPLLDKNYLEAFISSMRASAEIKASQAAIIGETAKWSTRKVGRFDSRSPHVQDSSMAQEKLQAEMDLLNQRYNLNAQDEKIKAEVLQSKEFQNDILEIQKRFMEDGDITPQHFIEFAKLILMKFFK